MEHNKSKYETSVVWGVRTRYPRVSYGPTWGRINVEEQNRKDIQQKEKRLDSLQQIQLKDFLDLESMEGYHLN